MVAHDFPNNNLQVVLQGKCADQSRRAWPTCGSNRRNPDEARFRDGNFDRLDAGREFCGMENALCLCTFQNRSEPGGLRNPQTPAQLSRMDPGPHNGGEPGGVGKAQSIKDSSIVLRLSLLRHRHAVPLKSPATKSIS